MYLRGLKSNITITLLLIVVTGMLSLNLVMIMLWQGDLLKREVTSLKIELELVSRLYLTPGHLDMVLLPGTFLVGVDDLGKWCFESGFADVKNYPPLRDIIIQKLQSVLHEDEAKIDIAGSIWAVFAFSGQWLFVGQPIYRDGAIVGAVGARRSLEPGYRSLWQAEKTTCVYMLINTIVLVVIGFFRMTQQVIRPIEKLAILAGGYKEMYQHSFVTSEKGGELAELAGGLKAMIARIESDKMQLQMTVEQLSVANRQLKDNQQELIRTEKLSSVGRLAAGLAHEIGNPLGIIQGYLGLLAQDGCSCEQRLEYTRRAEHELLRMTRLIRQLLDYSRPGKGVVGEVFVHTLLEESIAIVRLQSTMRQVEITCDFKAEEDRVLCDPDHLGQVFMNCFMNSLDAIQEKHALGGGAIIVRTLSRPCSQVNGEACVQGNELEVMIVDDGVGVPDALHEAIFDPFVTSKDPGKGTGLGLSVSLAIVEELGGGIEVKSEPGHGAMFVITLPTVADGW